MIRFLRNQRFAFCAASIASVLAACISKRELEEAPPAPAKSAQAVDTTGGSDCLAVAERLQSQQALVFSGFAEGTTLEETTSQAAADLVRQIQTRISSQGTTAESNRSVEISSLTQTTVDALLTGLSTEKRCRNGARWEIVVKLERATFFRNIQLRVAPVISEASQIRDSLANPATSRGESLALAAKAKSFIKAQVTPARDLLSICRTFQSCSMVNAEVLDEIGGLSDRVFRGFAFALKSADAEASAVTGNLTRMLGEEGFALADSAAAQNTALASCQRKDFPPMVQTGFMVTELVCTVSFMAGDGQPVSGLVRNYRGHGLGENREEALREARRKLEKNT